MVTPLVLGRRAAVAAGDMLQTERHTQHCVCMACRSNLKKEKRLRNRVNAFRYKKGGFGARRSFPPLPPHTTTIASSPSLFPPLPSFPLHSLPFPSFPLFSSPLPTSPMPVHRMSYNS